jgi:hypothetical protein
MDAFHWKADSKPVARMLWLRRGVNKKKQQTVGRNKTRDVGSIYGTIILARRCGGLEVEVQIVGDPSLAAN